MPRYNVTIAAICSPQEHCIWEREAKNGYIVTIRERIAYLRGVNKTPEEYAKIEYLLRDFPDHYVAVEEAHDNETETRQAPFTMVS